MSAENRKRLGQAVVARRVQMDMKTTKALAHKAGLSPRMLGDVENGRRDNFSTGAKAQIERALEWAPGSIDGILEGGDPIPLDVVAIRERLQDEVYRTRFELFDLRDQRYEKPMAEWTDRDLDAEDEMEIRLHATEAEIRMLDASVRNAAENRLIDLVQDGQVLAARRSDAELNAYVRQVESAVVGMVGFARVNEELAARQPVPGIEQRLAGDPKPGAGGDEAHGG